MNLWLRFFWMALRAPFLKKIRLDEGLTHAHRVWLTDLDANFHLTNSRYASFADLARVELLFRSGLLRVCYQHNWRPMLATSKIRFRRQIRPFRKFRVQIKTVWWNETSGISELRFYTRGADGAQILNALILERVIVYSASEKRTIPSKEIAAALGFSLIDFPEPRPEILAFAKAEEEMRKVK